MMLIYSSIITAVWSKGETALRHPVNDCLLFKQEELDALLKQVELDAKQGNDVKKPR